MVDWTSSKPHDPDHLKLQLEALDSARERLIEAGGNASLVVGVVSDKDNGQYVHFIERRGIYRHFLTIAALMHNRLGEDGIRNGFGIGPSNDIIIAMGRSELCIETPLKH